VLVIPYDRRTGFTVQTGATGAGELV